MIVAIIEAPFVFNTVVAGKEMPQARKVAIGNILHQATEKIGEKTIFELSAMKPPQFYNMSVEEFHQKSVQLIQRLQLKYKDKILKYGLSPRSGSKISNHPERIYLTDSLNDLNSSKLPETDILISSSFIPINT